ncbi:ATP-binding cassette domain-containing protein [Jonesia quinghaiensis]|uniref:ATP-binding cassette domain-containing protein n=1 Tax=Jonesia quinghaiensis TaxID=262806 RepID=UPI000688C4F6|nr:ATP-binding cassette domain-containing protein [Jonesia quinghaiensis]
MIRSNNSAYVPQDLALVEYWTALENVMFPLYVQSVPYGVRRQQAHDALTTLGLARHDQQRLSQLSGGQLQRVANARAIAGTPQVLLADEPTRQLDSTSSKNVMDIIHELSRASNIGAIVTTCDPIVVARADRVLEIHDGRVLPVGQ